VIDSTLATPINQRPVEFGIDLVIHSGTKYFGGHSDLICGVVAGRLDLIQRIHETRTILGVTMDPHAAWLLLRGIKTLAVRVQRQNENALRIAKFLSGHTGVQEVHYPFLEGHPQYELAVAQMRGGGGMLSFEMEGTGEDARRLVESLRLFTLAVSLGGVDSLVTLPRYSSHAMISEGQREKMGVSDRLIRVSVGIENVEDLIADLEQAFAAATSSRQHAQVG
jgi:cystathionine beta-lyase/cystathionine gamma-synthase